MAWWTSDGRYQLARHIHYVNKKLVDLAACRIKRLMIFEPPRHSKSELCSKYFPAWFLGTYPQKRVILLSYETTFAESWGRKARDLVGEYGPSLFGVRVASNVSSSGAWDIDKHAGGMVSSGIRGGVTGRGADLLIIDDPVKNAEEALSPTIREKNWDEFQATASTRLEPDGRILLMQTRWHPDDLAGRILQEQPGEWDVVRLPALAGEDDLLGRQPGEALWPERWPASRLLKIKSSIDSYWWNSIYDQRPTRSGKFEWPDEYFGEHLLTSDWPSQFELVVIAIDPSKGKDSRKGDYSAIVAIGVRHGKIYVDSSIRRRPVSQIVLDGIAIQNLYGALGVGVESNQFQELLGPEFTRVNTECGGAMPLPLYMIPNMVNKELRIGRLGPYLMRRELAFRDTPDNRLLIEQLKEFPNGEHDDGPDALEMAIRLGLQLQGQTVQGDGLGHNLIGAMV